MSTCCCVTRQTGSSPRSAPVMSAMRAIPSCRSRNGTSGASYGSNDMKTPAPIDRLIAIMTRLRDKERGCPWDLEQDFATIAPYTIEEAYEVADAIERGDMAAL